MPAIRAGGMYTKKGRPEGAFLFFTPGKYQIAAYPAGFYPAKKRQQPGRYELLENQCYL
jgi:hypothetical protein